MRRLPPDGKQVKSFMVLEPGELYANPAPPHTPLGDRKRYDRPRRVEGRGKS